MKSIQIQGLISYLQDLIKDINMKSTSLFLVLFSIVILSCKSTSEENVSALVEVETISDIEVTKNKLVLNGNEGNWYYNNNLFNGFLVSYGSNGNLEQKVGFLNGKKEGVAKIWFPSGQLKVESNYRKNKLVGSYRAWWKNGVLASESNYENGKLHGVEKRWYDSGQLAKQMHYTNGKQEGMQQAWLKNGKIYVNYEAKNGRIFGMKKANLCYQLEDEVVITDARSESIFGDAKKKE